MVLMFNSVETFGGNHTGDKKCTEISLLPVYLPDLRIWTWNSRPNRFTDFVFDRTPVNKLAFLKVLAFLGVEEIQRLKSDWEVISMGLSIRYIILNGCPGN